MLLRFSRFFLSRQNAFDLPANKGAIALIETRDLQHCDVLKLAHRISQKQICQVASPFKIKIHRQKSDVIGDIDEAEAIIEFDAIEDRQCIWRDVDVVEVEVAVTIANAMLLNWIAKQFSMHGIEAVREITNCLYGQRRDSLSDGRFDLCKIFVGANLQLFRSSPLFNFRSRGL